MLKKVLVLVDGTENSLRALAYAREACKLADGELIVMTAVKTEAPESLAELTADGSS